MEVQVFINGQNEALVYKADRIEVLDFEMTGIKYKQIRCFKNGSSTSELIKSDLVDKIFEKN
ncbi:hypothetical protein SAMN02745163_00608 [Clostridium cavendishii DSM 21758]|uniref:Uncharacterized protein n=1 Tax=Clostridium cavendishii DSM 21758 TaxID=1121302 RepID=A0A1M6D1C1_9CLOT|nr:hypothetical protein [Clostridium cavendishii]SHI67020.1 hypothetical protein SAMN02745163_00608 [Clostridium cavendishii DSM 21758]